MHQWHVDYIALFEDVGQLKRAWYYPKKNERTDQSLRIQILSLLSFYIRCSWKGQVKRNQRRMSICIVCLDCFTINYGEHGFDSFLKGITYFHII